MVDQPDAMIKASQRNLCDSCSSEGKSRASSASERFVPEKSAGRLGYNGIFGFRKARSDGDRGLGLRLGEMTC